MLQRSQPFGDAEDWGVYVEVDDQLLSGYDCVADCELTTERMVVRLTEPLGRSKPVEEVEVRFTDGYRPSPEFVSRLRAIFAGREGRLRIVTGGAGS